MIDKPVIAITMGDPCGIGPEVVAKALSNKDVYASCRPIVIGNVFSMERAIDICGFPITIRPIEDVNESGYDAGVINVIDIHNLNPEDIEQGVEFAGGQERFWQPLDGIKRAGEKSQWRDNKICYRRQLIEFFGPDRR